ncbi:hypothetical protein D3C85_1591360 [compost metagenome]
MMMQGISQTTTSILVECDQSGSYRAALLVARYFQAKTSVRTITGTTTSSMSQVAIRMMPLMSTPT